MKILLPGTLYCFKNHKILFLKIKNRVRCEAIIFLTLFSPTQDSRDTCCHQFPSYPERPVSIQSGKTFLGKDQFLEANRHSTKKSLPCSEAEGDVGNMPSTCPRPWSGGPRVFSYHQRLENTRLRGFQELSELSRLVSLTGKDYCAPQ